MPELPEVEYAANRLRCWMQGERVELAVAQGSRILRGESPKRFTEGLHGRILQSVERRGKYLLLYFDQNVGLAAHLGMTGKLVCRRSGVFEPYSQARFELKSKFTVHFRDPRMFGWLKLTCGEELSRLPPVLALGPDAMSLPATGAVLGQRLMSTRRPIKVALMDQAVIAGLGNIQAAEALYRARINPRHRADDLNIKELDRLAQAINESLKFTLATMSPASDDHDITYVEESGARNPFLVYGKAGEQCTQCGTKISSFAQNGRTTYWCPGCQK